MANEVFGFDEQSTERIADAVRSYESLYPDGPKNQSTPKTRQAPIVHPLEITSTTPDGDGLLAGTLLPFFDSDTFTMTGDEEILILDLNA